jgi:hypothetical protein
LRILVSEKGFPDDACNFLLTAALTTCMGGEHCTKINFDTGSLVSGTTASLFMLLMTNCYFIFALHGLFKMDIKTLVKPHRLHDKPSK